MSSLLAPSRSSATLTRHTALAVALIVASVFVVRGSSSGGHRALLSTDLLIHEGSRTKARTRVIVHGTPDEIAALAEQHHLRIARLLGNGGAVIDVDSAELSALAADARVHHLSGDLPVWSDMSISNKSTAADQTRAGVGGLLGIGAIAGVTGQGIGVAVIDSGVSPHAALVNRIVVNVSFVTGDPIVTDPFGHGSHVAGIVPVASGVWYVSDAARGELVAVDAFGAAASVLRGTRMRAGDRLTGWVAANRQVVLSSDAALDPGERAAQVTPALDSCLSVPLLAGDSLVAVLTLYAAGREVFTDDLSRLVPMIAPHVARAIVAATDAAAAEKDLLLRGERLRAQTSRELRLVTNR